MAKRGFQGAVMRTFGARDHVATVREKLFLAPKFLRVRMVSDTLFEDAFTLPTAWLRFWFPDPEGGEAQFQRAYTITESNEETGEFAVDFVLHEPAGPASAWAVAAEPGAAVEVTALGSSKFELPEELPAGYLLIGDSASIPALNTIISVVPDEVPIEMYLEQHDADDLLIPLAAHPRLRIHWVPRRSPDALAAALEERDWSNWYAWTAPESATLKGVRVRLKEDFGFPKSEVYAQAYWIHGRAMGKLRSSAEEARPAIAPPAEEESAPVERTAEDRAPEGEGQPRTMAPAEPVRGAWRAQAAGRLLKPLRLTLILAGALQALVTLLQLAPFVLLVELARLLLGGAAPGRLWTLGIWALALMALGALLSSALLLWLHTVDARFERDIRLRLLSTLARVPLGWFDARTAGQIKQIVQDDTLSLHYLVTHAVPDAVAAVVAPVAVLVYLFVIDWRLALLLFVPVLVYIFMMASMLFASGAKTAQALRWAERMNSEANGYLSGQPVVRVFGGSAASTFRARLDEYIAFLRDWQQPFTRQKMVMDLVTRPTTTLMLIVAGGTLLITTAGADPLTILPFLFLGTTFGARLLGIGYGLAGLRTGLLSARRVQVTLDEPLLERAPASAGPEAVPGGQVEFRRVGFAYRPGVPVLEDIDLVLEPGTVTALVGSSGAGKSTLAALLARFHDVTSGELRIGGVDIRSLSADELYSRVGFVFQQTQLVQGTVHENIALAVPQATRSQVERAAQDAQIHERILRLPQGYDTMLGPDAALSGGEKQRLSIARALLADTPVLVLDEATAFADPESEYLVQRALNRLTTGRTVLVIAHRLHTITGVDRIVVLETGRIEEIGTHGELLAKGGRYRRLWDAAGRGEDAR